MTKFHFGIFFIMMITLRINIDAESIDWNFKLKHFLQLGSRFERRCSTNGPLEHNHSISWLFYSHDGHSIFVNQSTFTIPAFNITDEGIAICQLKDQTGLILDEKYFFLTNDPTELIDENFEGYDQSLIDTTMTNELRHCGPDQNIEYHSKDIADFHIDFIQHYERVRLHVNHIHIQNVKHEHEGYYECIVRLNNGLVGVRVFFLSVGGGPRHISLREKQIYAETNDQITILCPIFSALPAWYSFIPPKENTNDLSPLIGHDFIRIYKVSNNHAGLYKCQVALNEDADGYSLSSVVHLHVLGTPEYVYPHLHEHISLSIDHEKTHLLHCSIHGDPHPTYQWYQGDVSLLQRENRKEKILTNQIDFNFISHAHDAPGTNYTLTCIAKNNRGSKRQVFHLQLKHR